MKPRREIPRSEEAGSGLVEPEEILRRANG